MATDARRFDVLLFDLGSTLIYYDSTWDETLPAAYQALAGALREAGIDLDHERFLPEYDRRMKNYYNRREEDLSERTSQSILSGLLADFGHPDVLDSLLRVALRSFYNVTQEHWQVEDDTLPTLAALRAAGYRLGLVSNAADAEDVEALVDKAGIRACFELILISARFGLRKPHPQIFELALDHFDVAPARALMVGDRLDADIQGAQGVGMSAVWITRRAESLQLPLNGQPDAVISRLDELPNLLVHWPA